jgi:prepilin-type N-terminal cleavage/methylation domain-containing protein
MENNRKNQGFTLLEILLVVAAIAILAGIVILAVNPGKQIGDTNNARRRSDVTTILNAVYQYAIDHNGVLPAALDDVYSSNQMLGTSTSCDACTASTTLANCVNLSTYLVPTYIVDIPYDPKTGSTTKTLYYINKDVNGRVTVGSCEPEQSATIRVTR